MEKTINKIYAKDYRERARNIINPMKGDFAVVYFIYFVIMLIISVFAVIPYVGGVITAVFSILTSGAFTFSFISMSKEAKNKKKPVVGDLFTGFKRFAQALGIYIIMGVFILLWSLLLIIPGIIKSYSYVLAPYIAFDNPNKPILECITESRKAMDGHKWECFCMEISYIGWLLLVILTLGILSFWVSPKIRAAHYEFYLHITKQD